MVTTFLVAKNRAKSNLAAAITISATSLTVKAGEGANFPSTYPFHLTISDEIVSCTNRSTDTLTVVRAQQGTSAAAHAINSWIGLNITEKFMTDLSTAVNAIEDTYIHKDGSVSFTGTQSFNAPVIMTSSLDVAGASVFGAPVTMTSSLGVAGAASFGAPVLMYSSFGVAGTTTLALAIVGGGLYVAGIANLPATIINATLGVAARTTLATVTLGGKLTAGSHEIEGSNFDINGGNITGCDITVGSGKTLNVSAGTLTLANNQISGDKVEGGTIAAITIDSLTLGGTMDAAGNTLNNLAYLTSQAGDNSMNILARRAFANQGVALYIQTYNASNVATNRATVQGGYDTAVVTWANCTHEGFLASDTLTVTMDSETTAINAIWVSLKSTVTNGDLTGFRSRVYANAASAGANVRGGYLEAKMAAVSKFAAMLEGALFHADYSAGSATISGDVRGFTAHISQGSGLNAANLYGGLISIQTRGDETITSDDVGLMIRNEAVGGDGRTMDAGLKICDLNMGGAAKGFTIGIDLNAAHILTADIKFHHGTTLLDDGTNLTLAGANLVLGAGLTLGGTVTLNVQVFDAGSGDAIVNTTGLLHGVVINSTNDGDYGAALDLYHISASPAANDLIGIVRYLGKDSAGNTTGYAEFQARIVDPADGSETAKWAVWIRNSGANNEAMRVAADGGLSIDAEAGGAAGHVLVFDDKDDALLLRDGISGQALEKLEEIGVMEQKDTGSGWLLNLRPMAYLLAGGIYQNRALIDNTVNMFTARFESVDEKIERLESELALLKASLN